MIKKYILIVTLILLIIVFGLILSIHNSQKTISSNSLYNAKITENDMNTVWCGTFQIAWEELKSELNLSKIEFIDEENELANKLNNTTFGLNSISDSSYYLFVDDYDVQVSSIINRELKQKFNVRTKIFDDLNLENSNSKIIYSYLEKNYTFKNKFDTYNNSIFTTHDNNKLKIKTFGFLKVAILV